ncbi:hypothetical protein SAMN02745221_01078 [Thermosyntropha lipolytica DSM 11003]|uniref:Uncharacterized protein n=1 Tax=Thermosyntropha lipolytica DSM 11003 TaxID=1123382 RepID=A0A1M5N2A2_9FIRM|nr:hypothetical protein [Thermosyntropha lipolytica]SHG83542.1 hypothetical protein SAMN02745221_01078 [Thermosyntropha lipolytica DSM 11003]
MDLSRLLAQKHLYSEERLVEECHTLISRLYPGLAVRWAKIYGKRWAFIKGNQEGLSLHAEKYQLSPHIGIILDNPEAISPEDKKELLAALKECFNHGTG